MTLKIKKSDKFHASLALRKLNWSLFIIIIMYDQEINKSHNSQNKTQLFLRFSGVQNNNWIQFFIAWI